MHGSKDFKGKTKYKQIMWGAAVVGMWALIYLLIEFNR
jgi:hypothetical protein